DTAVLCHKKWPSTSSNCTSFCCPLCSTSQIIFLKSNYTKVTKVKVISSFFFTFSDLLYSKQWFCMEHRLDNIFGLLDPNKIQSYLSQSANTETNIYNSILKNWPPLQ
ncbi:hypothetical protein V8G54_007269, partial [Vigna mungo]